MGTSQKWALITGASASIGKQFCKSMAQQEWNLILVARREQLLLTLKSDLETLPNTLFVPRNQIESF